MPDRFCGAERHSLNARRACRRSAGVPAGRFKAFGLPSAFTESAEHRKLTEEKNPKMKLFKTAAMVGSMALLGAAFAPGARADDWNSKTVITFSGPVEIPAVHLTGWGVLPAGTYVFKILDSTSDRHIVQIFNQDETKIYATVLAIPNYRLKATDKTVMTFRERAAGEPEALRAWFYPGRNWGEEFVYPKSKAVVLAKTAKLPVLFTSAELPLEVAEPEKLADSPLIAQLRTAPVVAIEPTGDEVVLAQVVTPPPAVEMVADKLPSTASNLPLVGLFGLLTLCAAFGARSAAKRLL